MNLRGKLAALTIPLGPLGFALCFWGIWLNFSRLSGTLVYSWTDVVGSMLER